MDKVFVKKGELELINGGYVVLKKDQTPVSNSVFIAAQLHAEYIIEFAKEAKNKDFVGKMPDSLEDVKTKVRNKLYEKQVKEYVGTTAEPKMETTKKLEEEALAFIKFASKKEDNEKINSFLQSFNIINEYEDFGLFFSKDIVKLNHIYTMDEIIQAAKEVVDLV